MFFFFIIWYCYTGIANNWEDHIPVGRHVVWVFSVTCLAAPTFLMTLMTKFNSILQSIVYVATMTDS